MKKFYTESPSWHEKIGDIHAILERVKISEERSANILHLRKLNRIMSIHASTAIEGNQLTLNQVSDIINGKPVWGPPKDIKEVQNAWDAYNELANYNPWSVEDFLKAHALLTQSLIEESGNFRSVGVAIVRGDGVVMHRGSPAKNVPNLMDQLFSWGDSSKAHPLITSCAVHYMIEYIHPFRDGNGRIGRLWQTLILSKWNPLFAWMPIETLVHYNQALYYKALQDSHADGVNCRPFIDFMLDAISNSLHKYIDIATETEKKLRTVPVNDPVNDPVNIEDHSISDKILILLRANSKATIQKMALALGVSEKTIKRHLKELRAQGRLHRIGSDKTGYWEVVEQNPTRQV